MYIPIRSASLSAPELDYDELREAAAERLLNEDFQQFFEDVLEGDTQYMAALLQMAKAANMPLALGGENPKIHTWARELRTRAEDLAEKHADADKERQRRADNDLDAGAYVRYPE